MSECKIRRSILGDAPPTGGGQQGSALLLSPERAALIAALRFLARYIAPFEYEVKFIRFDIHNEYTIFYKKNLHI